MIQSILAPGQSHLVLSTAVGSVSHYYYYYSAALLSSTQTPFWYFDPTTYHSTSQAQNAGTLYQRQRRSHLPQCVADREGCPSDEACRCSVKRDDGGGDEEEGDNDDVDGRAN